MSDQDKSVLRLIGHKVPWPADHHERPGLELRWHVTLDGEEVIRASKRPFEDASAILATRGVDPDRLVTFRHEDRDYDSFNPMRLSVAAKNGLKRMESVRKMKEKLGLLPQDDGPEGP